MTGRAAIVLAFVATAALPAVAQAPADIVVEGERITIDQARATAGELVRSFGVAPSNTPAARWTGPICFKVAGLADKQAAKVAARLQQVAIGIGAPVAKGKCSANAIVSFTRDGLALAKEVDRKAPGRLKELPPGARRAYLSEAMPVRWWYNTGEGGSDGMPSSGAGVPGVQYEGDGSGTSGQVISGDAGSIVSTRSSLVSTLVERRIYHSSVVIDVSWIGETPLDLVADQAALLALAEIRPGAQTGGDSVLGLFTATPAPYGLTEWDVAFLTALYKLPLDRQPRQHRMRLVEDMAKARTGAKMRGKP